jgi:hypothetical protein
MVFRQEAGKKNGSPCPLSSSPLAVKIVMADLEIEKDIPLSGDFDFRIIPALFTDPRI